MTKGASASVLPGTPPDELHEAMPAAGDFATRLTIGRAGPRLDELAAYAADRRLRFVHIRLDRGRRVSQPMLIVDGASRSLAEMWTAAVEEATALGAAGFRVDRLKIGAAPWTPGVPATDEAAAGFSGANYFEHRVKLVLPVRFRGRTALVDTVVPHAAHLSRNARRIRPDGRQERFVTQRCPAVGSATARLRLAALTEALRTAGHRVATVEREFVVHDSDESLDAGWLTPDG